MSATATFGLSRITQIAVVVHDLPRAVAFYRDVLGMRLLFEAPPNLAFFDCAGVRLMLSLPERPSSITCRPSSTTVCPRSRQQRPR
jgi:methylmalonyl-CoA/ethylmalonyl-CoA epimerase